MPPAMKNRASGRDAQNSTLRDGPIGGVGLGVVVPVLMAWDYTERSILTRAARVTFDMEQLRHRGVECSDSLGLVIRLLKRHFHGNQGTLS